tara:strand:+ start:1994 stop:2332 length:339 start_codon:yes stop_codon:yes gene_type:complete
MIGQIIEVNVQGSGNCIAKVVEELDNGNFMVRYLSPYKDSDNTYKYEKKSYEVEPDMISMFHETEDEADIGYTKIDRNLFEKDSDSEYEPSTDEESDDEECVTSEEEFVDDE